jgi:heme exporter protein D
MNWSEFFSMGGYAFYIWGSYLAALILVGGEIALLVKRKNAVKRQASAIAGRRQPDNYSTDNTYETSS